LTRVPMDEVDETALRQARERLTADAHVAARHRQLGAGLGGEGRDG